MARKLRLEFEGAVYHVITRGNYLLGPVSRRRVQADVPRLPRRRGEKSGWQVPAWCVMTNHYHLAMGTPGGNLVAGMQWLQSTFALRFNRYRRECGHLFQGRYKSLLVDPADGLGALCHFLHLNPVRAGVTTVDRLADWAWRSFRWLMTPGERAAWYRPEACLEHAGGRADTAAGRRKDAEYLAWLAAHAPEQKRLRFDRVSKGWVVGTKEFKAALVDDHRAGADCLGKQCAAPPGSTVVENHPSAGHGRGSLHRGRHSPRSRRASCGRRPSTEETQLGASVNEEAQPMPDHLASVRAPFRSTLNK